MPTHEEPEMNQSDLMYLGLEFSEHRDIDTILFNILARYNEHAEQAQRLGLGATALKAHIRLWDEGFYQAPALATPSYGNELAFQLKTHNGSIAKHIPLGYYSPVNDGFVIFPELVTVEEEEAVTAAAKVVREKTIQEFATDRIVTKVRTDYEQVDVQALHREHNTFLDENNHLYEVLERRNSKVNRQPSNVIMEMDGCTQAAIGIQPDKSIALKIVGALTRREDFILRHTVCFIAITHPKKRHDTNAGFKPIEALIPSYEVDDIVEVSRTVETLKVNLARQGLRFDAQDLGIKLNPKP